VSDFADAVKAQWNWRGAPLPAERTGPPVLTHLALLRPDSYTHDYYTGKTELRL
jgi:hypothetical protein